MGVDAAVDPPRCGFGGMKELAHDKPRVPVSRGARLPIATGIRRAGSEPEDVPVYGGLILGWRLLDVIDYDQFDVVLLRLEFQAELCQRSE